MNQAASKRSRFLLGCGSAAMALGLIVGPAPAAAQGIQADGNVVFGSAFINQATGNQTTVTVDSTTAVIDWTPNEDANGNALTFLPFGSTATYEGSANFAVLNRILPATNGNVARIDGAVVSRIISAIGPETGGFVAFYSPTGILVGSTATFDVGQLLLTTLDTSNTSFQNFAEQGGTLFLAAAQPGSTARINIAQGAQILATQENGFFAVVAADVEMLGSARVNGSHAYVAGEVVDLTLSNGLFDISVPVGTAAAGEVVTLNGNVGGPASTGANGDNHVIYAVARASQDPISMLFSGNLGFDPVQAAGVINGEIILAANYDVFGRTVNGGSVSDGIGAVFDGNSAPFGAQADIVLEDFTASSSLLAIGTHSVLAQAQAADSLVAGNLMLVGRQNARLLGLFGRNFQVAGDVLVDARDYGVIDTGGTQFGFGVIDAQGGSAQILADFAGGVDILGNALVTADAIGGGALLDGLVGSARAGSASIAANDTSVVGIAGAATVSARGLGSTSFLALEGAEARGGTATVSSSLGSIVGIGAGLTVSADAIAANGAQDDLSTPSNAFGGTINISLIDEGGEFFVGGALVANASAFGGGSNDAGAGSIGDGGAVLVTVDGASQMTLAGGAVLLAGGSGGVNGGGVGGRGLGGRATIGTSNDGIVTIATSFDALASGFGGNGRSGGDGLGGAAGAIADTGQIVIQGQARAESRGEGGDAIIGFGGVGGSGEGGLSVFQATGRLDQTASLSIAGSVTALASGTGGDGGAGDSFNGIAAGRGGDGRGGQFGIPNQSAPDLPNSGALFLAGGDNGRISVAGRTVGDARAFGGDGGSGGNGGNGGNAFGGSTLFGLSLLSGAGLNGSVGLGRAAFGDIEALAGAVGGRGGFDDVDVQAGTGGEGRGGFASLTATAGWATAAAGGARGVTASAVQINVAGVGGTGRRGGIGRGGNGSVDGGLGGSITATTLEIAAQGFGGVSGQNTTGGAFGNAFGGTARIQASGLTVAINGNALLDGSAIGGTMNGTAQGGLARGGSAFITASSTVNDPGSVTISGHSRVYADGIGGAAQTVGIGGDGVGGLAFVEARTGGDISLGSAQVTATGRGGFAAANTGGSGTGGRVLLSANAAGSTLAVARNVPLAFANGVSTFFMLNADGVAAEARGTGVLAATGTGGTLEILARQGGTIRLPTESAMANDPAAAQRTLFMAARGFGGNSRVNLGTAGDGIGGTGLIEASGPGSEITLGPNVYSVLGQGGSSALVSGSIAGGNGIGGTRGINVLGGARLTIQNGGGVASGIGGNGSGNGNGGDGVGGTNSVVVTGGTLDVIGQLLVVDQPEGGRGAVGGDTLRGAQGAGASFVASNAVINMTPAANGGAGIVLGGVARGGDGVLAGGTANTAETLLRLTDTRVNGGRFLVEANAFGGNATDQNGTGGNALGGAIQVEITRSELALSGETAFSAQAFGGAGGTSGLGGTATSGNVDVSMSGTTADIGSDPILGPGSLRVQSLATGGAGAAIGNASSGNAVLTLTDANVAAARLAVAARATADGLAGQTGGLATSGTASLSSGGAGTLDAAELLIDATARTSSGGRSVGGIASLAVGTGGTNQVTVDEVRLVADGLGADPADLGNGAGRFVATFNNGANVNLINLDASAQGDAIIGNPDASVLATLGGTANVGNSLSASALGDITVTLNGGGLIGSQPTGGTTTTIAIATNGNLIIQDDDSGTTGLGGQSVALVAGSSILLDGNIGVDNGTIEVIANNGTALPANIGETAEFTMSASATLDAATGLVSIVMGAGQGVPGRLSGGITLSSITAGTIDVRNFGSDPGSDITVLATGVLTASGSGRAIDLAALNGEVINLHGDAGLILTGGGHYGIFAATPAGSQIGSFANYARRYNVANAAAYDAIDLGGNFAAFRIAPTLTVTADDISRFYGDTNPALTATFAGFEPGDSIADLAGAPDLATLANGTSNVGLYAITAALGTLLSEQGYQFSFAPGTLTVSPRPITVTADNLTRIYGNANPTLTFSVGGQGLVNGDTLTGALATAATGITGVGNVAITQGSLAASANYALTFSEGILAISPRPITVTADNLTRIYGNANPTLTFSVGGQGLVNGDTLTGALATTATATTGVGNVAITQGSLAASANYALTFSEGILAITPRPITVTADNLTRIYGNANPTLTFAVGGQGLVNGDTLTGALATTATATTGVGNVAITQGSLAASANYALTFSEGILAITPRPITVTADNLTRIYGNANPTLTFSVGGQGLVNGDTLTGALATTAGATTGVGNVAITQGSLAASANYALTFNDGILAITPRPITVTADNLTRIYGNANPTLTFAVGGQGLVNGDTLTGALATTAGATTGVGNVAITQGSLAASANYALTFNDGILAITPRPITVTADNLTRIYGNANPTLTFAVGGQGLVNGDTLTGALATTAGATTGVGNVAITQGSLAASANYALTFSEGILAITPRPISVTADNLSKFLGLADPTLTFAVGGLGLVNGDQLTGSLTRKPGETQGAYDIAQGTLNAGSNYTTTFVGGQLTINLPPAPPEIVSAAVLASITAAVQAVPPASDAEEEERFGMDFPERPDAPLISEDPLLDDPVTSGGDASLYGSGNVPPAGGK